METIFVELGRIVLLLMMGISFIMSKIEKDEQKSRHHEVLFCIFLSAVLIYNRLN